MENYYRHEKLFMEVFEQTEEKQHFHQDVEVLYVLNGSMNLQVEQKEIHMKKEDLFIVNANDKHSLTGSDDLMYVKLSIMYDLFSDIIGGLNVTFHCDSTTDDASEKYDGMRKLIQKLLSHYLGAHEFAIDFYHISLCYQIMSYMCDHYLLRKNGLHKDNETDRYDERIGEINRYIHANYQSAISMKDLAEKLYLSNGYLSRFFKKNYGMSFAEYLTQVRLQHAVEELLYTDIPITRIVYDNGFASVAIFNKAFKKEYGETPSEMRKKSSKVTDNEERAMSEETENRLKNMIWQEIPDDETGDAGEIQVVVSAQPGEKIKPFWSQIMNIGAAADLMKSEIREHIIQLDDMMHFQYVRFWKPFDKELLIDVNDKDRKYNFSRLDSILDFLVEHQIKPFIELEGKPERLQTSSSHSLIFGLVENLESLDNWKAVLTAFMNHVLTRYGRREVESWKFELWFDSDDLMNKPKVLIYQQKLAATEEIIRRFCHAQIGAAGLHAVGSPEEEKFKLSDELYDICKKKGCHPDFVSFYAYAYDSTYESGQFLHRPSRDRDFLAHSIDYMNQNMDQDFNELPKYITEWNLTFSDRNFINDSCFKGAYIIRNCIKLLGRVDALAYFRGTDRIAEYYDTNRVLFGGLGLLTKDGFKKPAAYAMEFLGKLYPYLVAKGENYIITTNEDHSYGIVCHNYKDLSYNYFATSEDELDWDHLNKYYEDMEPKTVKIQLMDMEDGAYQLKRYRINSRYGSVRNLWKEIDYESELSRNDLEYLKKACSPNLTMQSIEVRKGQAEITVQMDPNEITFVRLRKRVKLMDN